MTAAALRDVENQLAVPPHPGSFSEADLIGLPVPAQRMLRTAIVPGTQLTAAAHLRMRGSIRIGRWLPFRATQVIAPSVGFLWRARVAGIIEGYDRSVDGQGEMQWKLARLFTLVSSSGPDVSRSASGREAGEALWVPTALLPRFGVQWRADDDHHPVALIPTTHGPTEVRYEIDADGRVRSLVLDRWGDPSGSGDFGLNTFGGEMTHYEAFGGMAIPTRGLVGWNFRTPAWSSGAFFRFRITAYEPAR